MRRTPSSRSAGLRAAPVKKEQRIATLDVLRGLAIFGVLLANFTEIVSYGVVARQGQLAALWTADADHFVDFAVAWLITDKASTTLAFLFGVGFALQLQKLERDGAPVDRVFLQRQMALLAIGLCHMFFLWTWDILTIYALAGLVLMWTRFFNKWVILAIGVYIVILGQLTTDLLFHWDNAAWSVSQADVNYEHPILRLQRLSEAGDYFGLVAYFSQDSFRSFSDGTVLSSVVQFGGIMCLGIFVGRMGWLTSPKAIAGLCGRIAFIAIPVGLLADLGLYEETAEVMPPALAAFFEQDVVFETFYILTTPLIAVGYICLAVYLFETRAWCRILSVFAPVGQMALSNYVLQSAFIGFVLFGVGPGLALAGKIGSTPILFMAVAFFAMQCVGSRLWLKRYDQGPLEWVWRKLTYAGQQVEEAKQIRAYPRLFRAPSARSPL